MSKTNVDEESLIDSMQSFKTTGNLEENKFIQCIPPLGIPVLVILLLTIDYLDTCYTLCYFKP